MKECVMILGMHNSGTSLAATCLHAAGVWMGPRLLTRNRIPEDRRPKYDYLEDQDIVELQDETLYRIGRHWSSYKAGWPINGRKEKSVKKTLTDFEESLIRILENRFGGERTLWAVKDPRTVQLLPVWKAALEKQGIKARWIVMYRDPKDNCISFHQKGKVPLLWAEALWQQTYMELVREKETSQKWISFERLLKDPWSGTEEMLRFINLKPKKGWEKRIEGSIQRGIGVQAGRYGETASGSMRIITRELFGIIQNKGRESAKALTPIDEMLTVKMGSWLARGEQLELNNIERVKISQSIRKRVVVVTPELQGIGKSGGIGTAYLNLGMILLEAGHHVEIWLVGGGDDRRGAKEKGLCVRVIQSGGQSIAELSTSLASELMKADVDVVHAPDWLGLSQNFKTEWSKYDGIMPTLICGLHGPTAWTMECSGSDDTVELTDDLKQQIEGERKAILSADFIVSPSRYLLEWLRNWEPTVNDKVDRQYVQLNVPGRKDSKQEVNAEDPGSLIYFGRLEKRKGIELLAKAIKKMQRRPERVYLLGHDVLNGGNSQAMEFMEMTKGLGVEVTHYGCLGGLEARDLIRKLGGVVVIPSLIENSPYCVCEMLSTGIRVVATNVGGIPELLRDKDARCLSKPDEDSLAKALEDALFTDRRGEKYRLEPVVSPEYIILSWQAFHEELPSAKKLERCWPAHVLPSNQEYPEGVLLITLDSCRYDTYKRANIPNMKMIGPIHKANAPSYFTYGSHAAMFMGFLPSINQEAPILNSKYSKLFKLSHAAFEAENESDTYRLQGNSIVTGLGRQGFTTIGTGAVNWFDTSSETGIELTKDFEHFWFAGNSWSLESQLEWIELRLRETYGRKPFVFLNVGETHVPYWHEGAKWDRSDNPCLPFQKMDRRKECQQRQKACLEWVDMQLSDLVQKFLNGTIIICADHGDCWGENGLWEHGISHSKTLTVPLSIRHKGVPISAPRPKRFWL